MTGIVLASANDSRKRFSSRFLWQLLPIDHVKFSIVNIILLNIKYLTQNCSILLHRVMYLCPFKSLSTGSPILNYTDIVRLHSLHCIQHSSEASRRSPWVMGLFYQRYNVLPQHLGSGYPAVLPGRQGMWSQYFLLLGGEPGGQGRAVAAAALCTPFLLLWRLPASAGEGKGHTKLAPPPP